MRSIHDIVTVTWKLLASICNWNHVPLSSLPEKLEKNLNSDCTVKGFFTAIVFQVWPCRFIKLVGRFVFFQANHFEIRIFWSIQLCFSYFDCCYFESNANFSFEFCKKAFVYFCRSSFKLSLSWNFIDFKPPTEILFLVWLELSYNAMNRMKDLFFRLSDLLFMYHLVDCCYNLLKFSNNGSLCKRGQLILCWKQLETLNNILNGLTEVQVSLETIIQETNQETNPETSTSENSSHVE